MSLLADIDMSRQASSLPQLFYVSNSGLVLKTAPGSRYINQIHISSNANKSRFNLTFQFVSKKRRQDFLKHCSGSLSKFLFCYKKERVLFNLYYAKTSIRYDFERDAKNAIANMNALFSKIHELQAFEQVDQDRLSHLLDLDTDTFTNTYSESLEDESVEVGFIVQG